MNAKRLVTAMCGVGFLCCASVVTGQTITTWTGGTGAWDNGGMWTNGVPDDSGTFDVLIDNNNPVGSIVSGAHGAINSLNVSTGDIVEVGEEKNSNTALLIQGSVDNSGTMSATMGGQLTLDGVQFNNDGGTIVAEDNSTVSVNGRFDPFFDTDRTEGGTLVNLASGSFFLSGNVKDVQLLGDIEFLFVNLEGSIDNQGTLRAITGLPGSNMSLKGDVHLTGGGHLILNDSNSGWESFGTRFVNVDNTISGAGHLYADSIQFQSNSRIALGDNESSLEHLKLGSLFLVGTGAIQLDGSLEIDLTKTGIDPDEVNQNFGEMDIIRVFGSTVIDGNIELKFLNSLTPVVGDFFDLMTATHLNMGPNFSLTGPNGYRFEFKVVDLPHGPSGNRNALRATVTHVPEQVAILPGSFEVSRGLLISGTLADLLASDDSYLVVRPRRRDLRSVVHLDVAGNTINAFPSRIDINVETAVFARSVVNLEVEAYNFYSQEFELIDVRPANPLVDQVEVITLTGDLTQFVTPSSGSMRARIRLIATQRGDKFTANIDHVFWTIYE